MGAHRQHLHLFHFLDVHASSQCPRSWTLAHQHYNSTSSRRSSSILNIFIRAPLTQILFTTFWFFCTSQSCSICTKQSPPWPPQQEARVHFLSISTVLSCPGVHLGNSFPPNLNHSVVALESPGCVASQNPTHSQADLLLSHYYWFLDIFETNMPDQHSFLRPILRPEYNRPIHQLSHVLTIKNRASTEWNYYKSELRDFLLSICS